MNIRTKIKKVYNEHDGYGWLVDFYSIYPTGTIEPQNILYKNIEVLDTKEQALLHIRCPAEIFIYHHPELREEVARGME